MGDYFLDNANDVKPAKVADFSNVYDELDKTRKMTTLAVPVVYEAQTAQFLPVVSFEEEGAKSLKKKVSNDGPMDTRPYEMLSPEEQKKMDAAIQQKIAIMKKMELENDNGAKGDLKCGGKDDKCGIVQPIEKLSQAEYDQLRFTKYAKEHFDELDVNGNRQLDKDERAKVWRILEAQDELAGKKHDMTQHLHTGMRANPADASYLHHWIAEDMFKR